MPVLKSPAALVEMAKSQGIKEKDLFVLAKGLKHEFYEKNDNCILYGLNTEP